ncbi:MAG: glycerol-3-phosphate acyltransferase [Anaerolineae bacterium]
MEELIVVYGMAILTIVGGYLFGSIPAGFLIGRIWGVDLLRSGSGRTGGTNVLRAAGLFPALLTILSDAFKGLIPTYVAAGLFPAMPWVAALTGAATVLGHNHSIFLKFRGGAGGVTALGALGALSFPAAVVAAGVAIIAIVASRFASMATFSGSVTGLLMLLILGLAHANPFEYVIYGVIVVGLIGWSLRPNFVRIRAGTERKIGAPEKNITTV